MAISILSLSIMTLRIITQDHQCNIRLVTRISPNDLQNDDTQHNNNKYATQNDDNQHNFTYFYLPFMLGVFFYFFVILGIVILGIIILNVVKISVILWVLLC